MKHFVTQQNGWNACWHRVRVWNHKTKRWVCQDCGTGNGDTVTSYCLYATDAGPTLDELAAVTARERERVKADYDTFVTSTLTMEWGLSAEEIWRRVEQALEEQAGE